MGIWGKRVMGQLANLPYSNSYSILIRYGEWGTGIMGWPICKLSLFYSYSILMERMGNWDHGVMAEIRNAWGRMGEMGSWGQDSKLLNVSIRLVNWREGFMG